MIPKKKMARMTTTIGPIPREFFPLKQWVLKQPFVTPNRFVIRLRERRMMLPVRKINSVVRPAASPTIPATLPVLPRWIRVIFTRRRTRNAFAFGLQKLLQTLTINVTA